jgi:hypothetical protein
MKDNISGSIVLKFYDFPTYSLNHFQPAQIRIGGTIMKKTAWICWIAVIVIMFSQPVLADQNNSVSGPWERFSINLGGFITDLDSEFRLDSKRSGLGTVIDLENVLDLEETTEVFRVDALCRLGQSRRHRLDFSYFDLSRDATRKIGREIQFGDERFFIGTTVHSFFDLKIYKGAYTYSFFQNEHFDIGASLGLHVMDIGVGLSDRRTGTAQSETVTAPVPVVGLRGTFAFTPKLFLKESIEFFWVELDDYKGKLIDINIALEYNVWKHLGLGIGYNTVRIDISADGDDLLGGNLLGGVEFDYSGLQLYGKIYF